MTRPIKFRAYTKNGRRVTVYENVGILNGVVLDTKGKVINRAVLMQFTGLTDRHGKEIYEGDIVNGTWSDSNEPRLFTKMVVRFGEGEVDAIDYEPYSVTIIGFYLEYISGCDNQPSSITHYQNIEVIGNIYENPELLKN